MAFQLAVFQLDGDVGVVGLVEYVIPEHVGRHDGLYLRGLLCVVDVCVCDCCVLGEVTKVKLRARLAGIGQL